MYPLQISITDFNMDNTTSPLTLIIAAAIILLIFIPLTILFFRLIRRLIEKL